MLYSNPLLDDWNIRGDNLTNKTSKMTRINLVKPEELSDQHLVAEYREIFMVGSSLQRSMKSPSWEKTSRTLPATFTLNQGHVKFFYNKGLYLHKRYKALVLEMKRRGMQPDANRTFKKSQWPAKLYKDWKPTRKDLALVRQRIRERIDARPGWYRWTARPSRK